MKYLMALLVISFIFFAPQTIYATTAKETIKVKIEKIKAVLKETEPQNQTEREEVTQKILTIVNSVFDYDRLSQYALGKYWKKITTEEQKEFTKLFSRLLSKTYIKKVVSYGNNKFDVIGEKSLSDTVTEVRTKVHLKKSQVPVFYRLISKKGEWKVFDVIVEGVSLIKNYRSQFRNYLKKKSMSQLINALRKKT